MLNEPVLFITAFTILIFIGVATMAFTKYIALKLIHKIIRKTKTDWDDLLIQHGVIESIAKLGVFVLLKLGNTGLFSSEASILKINDVIISILIVLACIGIAEALLNLSLNVLQKLSKTSKFPAKSFIQALKPVSYTHLRAHET